MNVIQLFTKPRSGSPPIATFKLQLQQGYGIVGDVNAKIGSPRQVLMVDQRSLAMFDLQAGDLSENIVLDGSVTAWESGQVVQIGTAHIRITFACEPCAYLERLRPGLAKQMKGRRGVLGMVVQSGAIAPGDAVRLTQQTFPALSEDARHRFQAFVVRIPPGHVITTADLILALGVSRAYYRAIPALLKKSAMHLPVHRIVATDGSLLTQHLPDQATLLMAEGVTLIGTQIDDRDRWQPEHFYPLNEHVRLIL